jgi:hypothetical protein
MKDWKTEMADIIYDVACNLARKHGDDNRGILVLGRVRQCGVNSVVASGRHFQAALGVICSG